MLLQMTGFPSVFKGWIIPNFNVCTTFSYPSITAHLDCFHVLTIVDNAAVNRQCRDCFESLISIPLCIYIEVGLMDHSIALFLILCLTLLSG